MPAKHFSKNSVFDHDEGGNTKLHGLQRWINHRPLRPHRPFFSIHFSNLRPSFQWVAPIIAQLVNVLAGGVSMCYIENQVDTIFIRQVQQ